MYYSLKTVPVRLETLGQFTASNPWKRNPGEVDPWSLRADLGKLCALP